MHHTLTEYLKQYVKKAKEWPKWLPICQLAYNCAEHETHSFSPHELVFGRKARIPSSFPIGQEFLSYHEYLDDTTRNINELQTLAALNSVQAKFKSKYYYDRRLNTKHFRVGEMVYCLKEPKKGKLASEWIGPFEIIKIDYLLHNVELKSGDVIRVTHIDKIKRAFELKTPEIREN